MTVLNDGSGRQSLPDEIPIRVPDLPGSFERFHGHRSLRGASAIDLMREGLGLVPMPCGSGGRLLQLSLQFRKAIPRLLQFCVRQRR